MSRDYSIVCCSNCDKEIREGYQTYFTDKTGKKRYGFVCPECHKMIKKLEKDKIF